MSRGRPPRPNRPPSPGDLNQLMQQAMQMQEQMQRRREALLEQTFEGTAGGGVVSAMVKGDGTVDRVTIDESVLDDAELLGDLVVAAVNQALSALNEEASAGLGDIEGLGGLLG